MDRAELLRQLAAGLCARPATHPLRVGVDGVCGAGKSVFARDLVAAVNSSGCPGVLLDSDGFHHVSSVRRSGADPARGYFENAYDFDRLVTEVLVPLGPDGGRKYATRIHDLVTDEVVRDAWAVAPHDAVVVFDATFLQRAHVRPYWDVVVFLDADLSVARDRGIERDRVALGGTRAAEAAYDERYFAACLLYLEEERPRERADLLIDNTDPSSPRLLRPSRRGSGPLLDWRP